MRFLWDRIVLVSHNSSPKKIQVMDKQKLIPLVKGMVKHIPGVKELMGRKTGGTNESRYCYTVWMRHLRNWSSVHNFIPERVAEIGPGDSLGIGMAALLTGCREIHALDVYKYWDNERNLRIFNELVELFRSKASLPDNQEYPMVRPELSDYSFPSDIISDEQLEESLDESRLEKIRHEISDINNPANTFIHYNIPWSDPRIIEPESIDFIYSQAVLEHVEDLQNTYEAMRKWLKPEGLMSHSIDFKSHGTSPDWNGHWTYTDLEWKIIRGGKSFLINREPVSTHLRLIATYGFRVLTENLVQKESHLRREDLARKFANFSETDIHTSGVYVLCRKEQEEVGK